MTDHGKGKIATVATLWVLIVVSFAGIMFKIYGAVPYWLAKPVYLPIEWSYPVAICLLAFWLVGYRWNGILVLALSAAVFIGLAIRLKGLLLYPGTFEIWNYPSAGWNNRILVAALVGLTIGAALTLTNKRKAPADPISNRVFLTVLVLATALSAVNVFLTLFAYEPHQTFAPNQPLGIGAVWVSCVISYFVIRQQSSSEPQTQETKTTRSVSPENRRFEIK